MTENNEFAPESQEILTEVVSHDTTVELIDVDSAVALATTSEVAPAIEEAEPQSSELAAAKQVVAEVEQKYEEITAKVGYAVNNGEMATARALSYELDASEKQLLDAKGVLYDIKFETHHHQVASLEEESSRYAKKAAEAYNDGDFPKSDFYTSRLNIINPRLAYMKADLVA